MFAEIVVERSHKSVDRVFHYKIPEGMELLEGMCVSVPFGSGSREITGYVLGFSQTVDFDESKLKSVARVLSPVPVMTGELIALAKWMREKYYCTLADCIGCIMPPVMDVKSRRPKISALREAIEFSATTAPDLTDGQRRALEFIDNRPDNKPVLVHGVTGSGKTELYMELVRRCIESGKDAIMLVPEISLTPQTVAIFLGRFGERVAVTHSRLTPGERYDQWRRARDGSISIMIGPRSAVFAPFASLGLILVDEEHENSYKSEVTPKYSAKEVAVERGRLNDALVVLGSATPSVETYHEAKASEIRLVSIPERINRQMPKMHIVDMRKELSSGNLSVFSEQLTGALSNTLERKKQAILFLNRRGHSTFVSCRRCGEVLRCDNCSVNYTYHMHNGKLMCHYCGGHAETPKNCPVCGSKYIKYFGVGTQRVEDEVNKLFPKARVLRMDFDTTAGRFSHDKILGRFRDGKADVLVGTQMIAKGLDFPDVTLVGVIAADLSLNNGDYRAAEITHQLLTQVSGRAGRADSPGEVFIQSYNPGHYAITAAAESDYEGFYNHEISLRRQMDYPPFTNIFCIMFTGESEKQLIIGLFKLLEIMKQYNKSGRFEMLGPAPAMVSKIRKRYRWRMVVKSADEEKLKLFVFYCIDKLKQTAGLAGVNISVTLNPALLA